MIVLDKFIYLKFFLKAQLMLGLLFFFSRCEKRNTYFHLKGSTMGTSYSIKFNTLKSDLNIELIKWGIDSILFSINQEMSTWDPKSTISKFNRWNSIEPFEVSPSVIEVMLASLDVSKKTDGQFDVTVYELMGIWGFGPNFSNGIPSKIQLEKTLLATGYDKVKVFDQSLVKVDKKVKIDFNSIAKGYGVDLIHRYLKSSGINDIFIEIGGEVRSSGKNNNNQQWSIGIENFPTTAIDLINKDVLGILFLDNNAVATSGNYRNFIDNNGDAIGHTINPKTGYPIQTNVLLVTVISNSCMRADAWATALMTMDYLKGKKLVQSQDSLDAIWLIKLNDESKRIGLTDNVHLKEQRYEFIDY